MKLTIFGATGRTGRLLVQAALDAGHEVVAFARTPAKLATDHERLSIAQGDLLAPDCVAAAISGSSAVLSVVGPTTNRPVYEVSKGMANILAAMEHHCVRRLVQSVGAAVVEPHDRPTVVDRAIRALVLLTSRHVYGDMLRGADMIRQTDPDWTLVRVPMLTGDPPGDRVRTGYPGQGLGARISRANLASFVLKQAADTTFVRQAPVISN